MTRVVVAGHVCLDLAPQATAFSITPGQLIEIGPLTMTLGGSVANTGRALAALGHSVTASARVGDDELGGLVAALLAGSGVGGVPVVTPGAHTSYSIVVEAEGSDRSFWHHVGANAHFDGSEADSAMDAEIMHLGYPSLLPALVTDEAAGLRSLLARARRAGMTTSLDLAVVDPADSRDWRRILRDVMPLVDIVTPSADDLRSALRQPDASSADLVELLLGWGAGIAAVSDGSLGIRLGSGTSSRLVAGGRALGRVADSWREVRIHRPATRLRRRVTTNGAGDAATAGMISAILRGESPAAAVDLATAAAASVIEGDPITSDISASRLERIS